MNDSHGRSIGTRARACARLAALATVTVLWLALAGGAAQAQTALPPAIGSVTPYYGPPEGGTLVTITGLSLNVDPAVIFTFGGVPATVQTLAARSATVIVPPHAPGIVDVTATFSDGRTATLSPAFLYGAPSPIGHPGAVERVSVGTVGNQATVFSRYRIGIASSAITPDGRFVAFSSDAADLVLPDPGIPPRATAHGIFVRDRLAGTTTIVPAQAPENFVAAISNDGRYVAIKTDGPGPDHVYRHDRQSGAAELVSVSLTGTFGNNTSHYPAMSRDGRYVVFASAASDLAAGDTNGKTDVFLRDMQLGTTINLTAGGDDNADSNVAVSGDGQLVVFASRASNLVAGDANGRSDLFVYEIATGALARIGLAPGGAEPNGDASRPVVTPDGRCVAFISSATNLVAGDTNFWSDTFLLDRSTGAIARVSIASDGTQANGTAWPRGITADGRKVSFYSGASTLVAGDLNAAADVFVYDAVTGETMLVSTAADGMLLPGSTVGGAMTDDGAQILLETPAPLLPDDTNAMGDLYVKAVGNTPSGTNVQVMPVDPSTGGQPASITFSEVTAAGDTTVVSTPDGPAAPAGFELIGAYYDITTSASFTPPATVCVGYPVPLPSGFVESTLALYHYEGEAWVALPTISQDLTNHVLCASTNSFSPFAVFGRPPSDEAETGRIVGGGVVADGGDRAVFEFAVRASERGERGHIEVVWRARGGRHDRFASASVSAVSFSDDPGFTPGRRSRPTVDTVAFSGTGRWNGQGGYSFQAQATDQGEPGRGRDTFTVTIRNPSGAIVASIAGTLDAGNIQSTRIGR